MDANGTQFHLILGRDDWGRCMQEGETLADWWQASPPSEAMADVVWDDVTRELTLRPRLFRFLAAPRDVKPAIESRRGASGDRFGNLYWIDEDRVRIRVRSVGSEAVSDFWPQPAASAPVLHGDFTDTEPTAVEARQLSGLAVTDDHYLVAGTTSPERGLLIFDLFAGGPPTRLLWPVGVRFSPFDMAARPSGGVWILDRDNRRYWGLDRRFRVIAKDQPFRVLEHAREDTFQPVGEPPGRGTPERRFPEGLSYDDASPVEALDAIAIEALPDGSVLILDRNEGERFSRVLRYRTAQRLGEPVSLRSMRDLIEEGEDVEFTLIAHDFAYLLAAGKMDKLDQNAKDGERLFVASSEGNQVFLFALSRDDDHWGLNPLPEYLPMRRFGGKGLMAYGRSVYYDFGDTWVPLTGQRRPRYSNSAQIETRGDGFDSGEPDCVWHRLMLDACIPPETSVGIWSRAANTRDELRIAEWHQEPALYRRGDGSELPWLSRPAPKERIGMNQEARGTYELLFQRAQGRFLQLRLALRGNERATPRLQALRIWYPRFSYAKNYLPAVYREDPESGSFSERFLANLEGLYTTLEDKLVHLRALFHWQSAPAESLQWLAEWLGAALDPAWDERRRRLFIKHAMDFFTWRGTMHGVRMALALALDPDVCDCELGRPGAIPESRQRYRIVERYRTRLTPGIALGEPLRNIGPREVEVKDRWDPKEGGERLNERYRAYLAAVNAEDANAQFSLVPPTRKKEQDKTPERWAAFAKGALGFVPTVAEECAAWQRFLTGYQQFEDVPLPADMPPVGNAQRIWEDFVGLRTPPGTGYERRLWQDFLARRYGRIQALNDRYRTSWTGFALVSLFDRLPADGPALYDWYQFEAVVKRMHRDAHRFLVLIPSPGPNAELGALQERLELARRVVELEKPAHTIFSVGFYWALFRVAEARLGFDTLLDVGSRAPDLLPALVLNKHFIGGSHLALSCVRRQDQRMSLECLPLTT